MNNFVKFIDVMYQDDHPVWIKPQCVSSITVPLGHGYEGRGECLINMIDGSSYLVDLSPEQVIRALELT